MSNIKHKIGVGHFSEVRMIIGSIGYNYIHKEKFVMDYPNGVGCNLMLIVKEPSVFFINNKKFNVQKNSLLLFSSNTTLKYYGENETYTDDRIYFNLEPDEDKKFTSLGIEFDKPLFLRSTDELSQIVRTIAFEHYSTEENHSEVKNHYTEIFLLKLSIVIKKKNSLSKISSEKNNRFVQIRNRIYSFPESVTDVESLAAEMGMSRSGFQHSYKKTFGVNVIDDFIASKMEKAKTLLNSTNLSVNEVALKCGYTNAYGFMKRFKMQFGCTPTVFRKTL